MEVSDETARANGEDAETAGTVRVEKLPPAPTFHSGGRGADPSAPVPDLDARRGGEREFPGACPPGARTARREVPGGLRGSWMKRQDGPIRQDPGRVPLVLDGRR